MIHDTATLSTQASIGSDVQIGPYCVIGPDVTLHDGVKLHSHVCITGITEVGEGTEVFPFATLGFSPQDLKYSGEESKLIIGKNNKIREYANFHPGTKGGIMETRVGDNCLFMISTHVAHDCIIGNNVIMANNATLGGHVIVGNNAILGGLSAVHQHVRIGEYAFIGGVSPVSQDVPPYAMVRSKRSTMDGINTTGLKRAGFSMDDIRVIREVYQLLFFKLEGMIESRIARVKEKYAGNCNVDAILEFLLLSNRGICMPDLKS